MSVLVEDLSRRAIEALAHWRLPEQVPELLKYRENAVFKVRLGDGGKAALRLHRPGYHERAALLSELQWMADLRSRGLAVPRPLATPDGRLLVELEAAASVTRYGDLIGWMDGAPIGESGTPLSQDAGRLAKIYFSVGAAMADLHTAADAWLPPPGFSRPAWDLQGLLGETPFWGRFWDCPGLADDDRLFLGALRQRLPPLLGAISSVLDFGLIHADIIRENVLVSEGGVAIIDFDDCGHGWRLFDLATTLLRNRREEHYAVIRTSLLNGYASRRPLSAEALSHLPLFLLLRGLTYIGWLGARPELPDAGARMARYVADARQLAGEWEQTI